MLVARVLWVGYSDVDDLMVWWYTALPYALIFTIIAIVIVVTIISLIVIIIIIIIITIIIIIITAPVPQVTALGQKRWVSWCVKEGWQLVKGRCWKCLALEAQYVQESVETMECLGTCFGMSSFGCSCKSGLFLRGERSQGPTVSSGLATLR